ncbi:MAG TPA: response regulator [Bryobacteraceae bacterium]|nr:response regulator [Bryobacteraceae bacterium]
MGSFRVVAVVDDDPRIRGSIGNLLEPAGFTALMFASAEEFLESAQAGAAACLILDVRMPGMGGLELQRRLKADFPALRVIIVTGHPDGEIRDRALREGVFYFLHKPFDGTEPLRVLTQALNPLPGRE